MAMCSLKSGTQKLTLIGQVIETLLNFSVAYVKYNQIYLLSFIIQMHKNGVSVCVSNSHVNDTEQIWLNRDGQYIRPNLFRLNNLLIFLKNHSFGLRVP